MKPFSSSSQSWWFSQTKSSRVERRSLNYTKLKVLRDLPVKSDHTIMSIEESKYLLEMKLEELQASLEVCELRLK